MSGPATRAELEELHRRMTEVLLDAMEPGQKRRPGAELMAVVGSFLRQEGIRGFLVNQRRVKRLEALYHDYVGELTLRVKSGSATSVDLAEVGKLLRAAEVTRDGSSLAMSRTEALQSLASMDLPFKPH